MYHHQVAAESLLQLSYCTTQPTSRRTITTNHISVSTNSNEKINIEAEVKCT